MPSFERLRNLRVRLTNGRHKPFRSVSSRRVWPRVAATTAASRSPYSGNVWRM